MYQNLVKGLQVDWPNRLTGCRSDLCSIAGRLCLAFHICWKCIHTHVSAGVYLGAWMRNFLYRHSRWHWLNATVSGGLIHHADRGRQYCSNVYIERLLKIGAYFSMLTPGQPTNNAFARSFCRRRVSGKKYICTCITLLRRRQPSLQMFLEDVYNAKRLHSSLDYVPPDEFELKYSLCSRLSGLDFLGALQNDKLSNEL